MWTQLHLLAPPVVGSSARSLCLSVGRSVSCGARMDMYTDVVRLYRRAAAAAAERGV